VIFDQGESIGKFKVLGGHFSQQVNYLANYKLESSDGCWVYKYGDQGGANFDLTFDQGQISPLKYRTGYVDFVHGLRVSGSVSRKWSGSIANQPGPNNDDSCDPPRPPTSDHSGCREANVKGADSFPLGLAPTKGNTYSLSGHDAALYSLVFENDPLAPCPSDSIYGGEAVTAGSSNGMKELDDVKVGDTIKLKGDSSRTGPGPDGFNVPFDWTSGSQSAKVNWSLKLKRVPKR
jgi:hypothetical protein